MQNQITQIELTKSEIDALKELTELNDHSGAYELAARMINERTVKDGVGLSFVDSFAEIRRTRDKVGYLPHSLYLQRNALFGELLLFAKENMSTENYKVFYKLF